MADTSLFSALQLLDLMYIHKNESIRTSFDKLLTLAQLEPQTGTGPFQRMYYDFCNLQQSISELNNELSNIRFSLNYPQSHTTLSTWINHSIASNSMICNDSHRITQLENKLSSIESMLNDMPDKTIH